MKGFFVIIITSSIMSWVASQARTARARKLVNSWVFSPVWALQAIFLAVLAMAATFIYAGYFGPEADRAVVVAIGLLFIVFPVVAWPKAVHVSESGLRQRSWRGAWKTIAWPQVSEAKEQRDRTVVLRGNGVKIIFPEYNADRELFLKVIRRNAPTALPTAIAQRNRKRQREPQR
jgi:hypothetical protein